MLILCLTVNTFFLGRYDVFLGDVSFGYLDLALQLNRYCSGFTDVLSDDVDQIKRLFGVK